jgi:hypothetical protein
MRRMRILALGLLLLAADERYGYTNDQLTESAFDSVANGYLAMPWVTAELKGLAPAARAQAVTTLGKAVRGIVESQAFKDRYREHVASMRPEAPKPKRSYDQFMADLKKQMADQKAEAEKNLANIDPKQKKDVMASVEQGQKQMLEIYKDRKMVDMMEDARFNQEKQSYDDTIKRYPEDLNVKLKALLVKFMADTDGIDYAAKTVPGDYGKTKFANNAYESKNDLWKRAFRAGKPTAEAARGFAKEWLAALK